MIARFFCHLFQRIVFLYALVGSKHPLQYHNIVPVMQAFFRPKKGPALHFFAFV
uniref:Uncharacterized protein n=1 Tax=Arundo donax TaxID=35708 RepID=A0A0A9HR12_ARUDO